MAFIEQKKHDGKVEEWKILLPYWLFLSFEKRLIRLKWGPI
jgi:hypothetical protein